MGLMCNFSCPALGNIYFVITVCILQVGSNVDTSHALSSIAGVAGACCSATPLMGEKEDTYDDSEHVGEAESSQESVQMTRGW